MYMYFKYLGDFSLFFFVDIFCFVLRLFAVICF